MGFFPTLWFHRIYSNKLGLYINFLLYMSMTTNTCSNSCFFIHLGFHMHWFSIPLYFLFFCFEILQIKDPATVMNLYCCISKEVVFFLLQTSFFVCIFFCNMICLRIIEIHNFLWSKTKLFYTYEGSDYAIKT
jgi:hypothetical protein